MDLPYPGNELAYLFYSLGGTTTSDRRVYLLREKNIRIFATPSRKNE